MTTTLTPEKRSLLDSKYSLYNILGSGVGNKKKNNAITQSRSDLFSRLRDKPFWNWDEGENHQQKGDCCFNHIIGLPENKPGLPQAIFDFQRPLYDRLMERTDPDRDKHVWIKKATGI